MAKAGLEILFGGQATVKALKYFLFNQNAEVSQDEAIDKLKESKNATRIALNKLVSAGIIRRKMGFRGGNKGKKKRMYVFSLNPNSSYTDSLEKFFLSVNNMPHKEIVSRVSKAGNVKLIIVSGIFTQNPESRIDLLVVGDNLKKLALKNAIGTIESLLGKEIKYTAFETSEFNYRMSLYDKLIRDILDFPHEKLVNKLQLA